MLSMMWSERLFELLVQSAADQGASIHYAEKYRSSGARFHDEGLTPRAQMLTVERAANKYMNGL